jgi:hypothetical protein
MKVLCGLFLTALLVFGQAPQSVIVPATGTAGVTTATGTAGRITVSSATGTVTFDVGTTVVLGAASLTHANAIPKVASASTLAESAVSDDGTTVILTARKLSVGTGGSASTVVCWKSDGITLGYATVAEITAGTCH